MDINQRDYEFLHILRTFACIWVVSVHWEQRINLSGILHKLCAGGGYGPLVFFVLSGFLTFPSLEREMERHKKKCGNWLIKRAVRLLLLYYTIILFYFIFYTVAGEVPIDGTGLGWLRYIFLINDCIPSESVFWTNCGAVWTVSAFMFFDLLVPLYYKLVKNYRMAWIGVAVMFLLAQSIMRYTNWFHTLQFFYFFALGILAYFSVIDHREYQLVAAGSVLLLMWLVITGQCEVGMVVMMFIVATSNLSIRNKRVVKCLSIFNQYSYSIYLVHAAVLIVLDHFYHGSAIIYTIIFLIVTGLCSFVAYQLIEKYLGSQLIFLFSNRDEGGVWVRR